MNPDPSWICFDLPFCDTNGLERVERGFVVNIVEGSCCYDLLSDSPQCVDGVLTAECGDDEPGPFVFVPDGNCPPGGPDCSVYFGACCETLAGTCESPVTEADCSGSHSIWTSNVACEEIGCVADTGACCNHDPFGPCSDGITLADCQCPTCDWHKGQTCEEIDCPPTSVPTVTAWGLAALSLLLMIGAKVVFGRGVEAQHSAAARWTGQ